MDFKDTQFITVFENSTQVAESYPDMFEKVSIDNSPIYIEKMNPYDRDNSGFFKEDRFFVLPSGVVSILATDPKNNLWNIDEEDTAFFEQLNKSTAEVARKRMNHEDPERVETQNICGIDYDIKYYFYGDGEFAHVLANDLDQRELHWKGLPPRR